MKLPKRIRLTAPALQSRAAVEETLREIALITIQRNKQQLCMDERITQVKEEFELVLTESGKHLKEKTELVRTWAEANPAEFGKSKSLDMTHARIGFRTGQPAVKFLSGWKIKDILEAILKKAAFFKYLRKTIELDKEALIRDRETLAEDKLREVGLKIDQDESFYVEPKLTELENTIKA